MSGDHPRPRDASFPLAVLIVATTITHDGQA
jgi:hypothetical protein